MRQQHRRAGFVVEREAGLRQPRGVAKQREDVGVLGPPRLKERDVVGRQRFAREQPVQRGRPVFARGDQVERALVDERGVAFVGDRRRHHVAAQLGEEGPRGGDVAAAQRRGEVGEDGLDGARRRLDDGRVRRRIELRR